ncbi:MAG TPA: ABC transporter substrate-binding protein [Thermoanaerobaculia bacterium]|nr:ABC transporter substrate-binding protein [Thermoanaerobaculia bacterium]
MRIALYTYPSQTDPHAENEFVTLTVLSHIYEPLVTLDRDLRLVPALAERWDNPNDLTWRFHLRQGVRFHDGHPLTADDVVQSLERVRRNPQGAFAGYLVAVHDVRALDPTTVEITTDHPSAVLLRKLAFVMVVPARSPDRILRPIGTGPYRLVRWETGRITLTAYAGYWGGPPALRDVELVAVADDRQRTDRLLAHEVDLAQSLPPAEATRLRGAAGVRVAMREGMSVEYLQPRVDRPPLADPRVREAISLALDRQGLVDELLLGYGRPTIQLVPPLAVGYAPELQPPRRDLPRARRLLAEAGYPQGLDLELDYREGRRLDPLARQLAAAGIRVRLVPLTWEDLNARMEAGRLAFHYGALVSETADASDVLDTMVHSPEASRGWGSTNFSGYANPELDRLIEASGVAARPRERRDTLQRCLRIVSRDLPFIPLFVPHEIYGVSDGLVFTPRLDGSVLAQEMRRRQEGAPRP